MIIYTRLVARITRPISLRPQQYTQRQLSRWPERLLASALIIALLAFLTLPLAALALRSITRIEPLPGKQNSFSTRFTLDFYKELATNRRDSLFYVAPTTAMAISMTYAFATVIMALVLGLPASWALARQQDAPLNRWVDPILMLPLGTSAVTLGLGFIVALDTPPLDLRASPILVPFAHTLVAFPFVVRSLTPALCSIRPRIRHAAQILGASQLQSIRYIDLPLVGRALLVSATFAFTISLGEFGATALVARPDYPTLPIMIYRFLSQPGAMNYGQALALSTMLMIITAAGILAIERVRVADIGEF
jgi:thiamine transport system permease protein